MKNRIILGCIADDFTGASDAASFLTKGGMRTVLFNGIPQKDENLDECSAVVIALKTRTQETKSAVDDTLKAAEWLKEKGAKQLYIKYCSTFDSTKEGNIGPIMDALLEKYNEPYTLLCPGLPINGRTVKDGHLYVNGVPLNESPMKDHPLTPMWDSDISNLMKPQSRYPAFRVSGAVSQNMSAETALKSKGHYYMIPDHETEEDAKTIVEKWGYLPILSGGSGILTQLAINHMGGIHDEEGYDPSAEGKGLLLAGSCSAATRAQIRYFQHSGGASMKMDPLRLADGTQKIEDYWDFLTENRGSAALVYSSDDPDKVKAVQRAGKEEMAAVLEKNTAELAAKAVEAGYTRIIVAGGETSGAVTKRLGFNSYLISDSVAPGVPVMIPRSDRRIRLVLKSGNFGQEDFFARALSMTRSKK